MKNLFDGHITRRAFAGKISKLGVVGLLSPSMMSVASSLAPNIKYEVKMLTSGPKHHFFGYYGICPWNLAETHLLSLESNFIDHMPKEGDTAAIGLVDVKTGKFERITQTSAWNMQQGAMMHWHPKYPNEKILYNDEHEGQLVSVIYDIRTSDKKYLPNPVSGLDDQGNNALYVSYARTGRLRKVVGYQGLVDPYADDPHPDKDGVFLMDLSTGKSKLVVSIRQVYELIKDRNPGLKDKPMWFNHTEFNPSGQRFFFLARTWNEHNNLETGMYSVNINGSNLVEAIPYGKSVSHFDWRNDREIIATFKLDASHGRQHILFTDGQHDYRPVASEMLVDDGHCTFAPDGNWLATDRNHADTISKALWVYNVKTHVGQEIGNFPMKEMKYLHSDVRCDLHPRWNRSGDKICVDALDPKDWTRQIYIVSLDF